MIAEVVINNISRFTDNIYHYVIPEDLNVNVGSRVVVPFGRGNKTYEAYVLDILEKSEYKNLKEISKLVDNYSYFNENISKLIKFMHHRYFSPYCDIIKAILPRGVTTKFKTFVNLIEFDNEILKTKTKNSLIKEKIVNILLEIKKSVDAEELCKNIGRKNINTTLKSLENDNIIEIYQVEIQNITDKTVRYATLSIEKNDAYSIIEKIRRKMPAQSRILEIICEYETILVSELLEYCNTSLETLKSLIKKGYVSIYEDVVFENYVSEYSEIYDTNIKLTDEQKNAVNTILNNIGDNKTFLIHGITGSGKTEVYLKLIEHTIKMGKQAIFLVPEISLTPQMIKQVTQRFGDKTAVMHSRLTMRERYDEWKRIKNGSAKVVVGARSAIFAPFNNLGLIVIDEEHEASYKSETSPRYCAKEIARFRCKNEGATLVLASATPSVESYYNAKNGTYKLIELKNRINSKNLPNVDIVDMREEICDGNRSLLSEKLKYEIQKNIDEKKQTILFLNKRGFSSFVSCRSCGYVPKCPNCNISLTYHKSGDYFVCHYCDYKQDVYSECPECNSKYIKHFGVGTQKIVDEIQTLFPDATVLRMDADTTSEKFGHEKILNEFREKNADILVGTQMIAKGLDFPSVTLVGVINADLSLYLDDFRSSEKTFSLITQVIGRSGRGDAIGRAIIQTYNPDEDVLKLSKLQDYISFYHNEIDTRKGMIYPPYCEMINIVASSSDDSFSYNSLKKFRNELIGEIKKLDNIKFIRIYNVTKAPMQKINGKYRYRFLIKLNYNKRIYNVIHNVLEKNYKNDLSIIVDVNPINMY